jgi:hypothetical protein
MNRTAQALLIVAIALLGAITVAFIAIAIYAWTH